MNKKIKSISKISKINLIIEIEEIFQLQEQISQDILTDMNSRENDRKDKFDLIFNLSLERLTNQMEYSSIEINKNVLLNFLNNTDRS